MDVDNAVARHAPILPRWVKAALIAAFNLYCVVRTAAAPRRRQPCVFTQAAISVPEGIVRAMRRCGVTWLSERHRERMCQRAMEVWDSLLLGLTQQCHVIWFDNYYRRRRGHNPLEPDLSLNCTAVALLPLSHPLPPHPGFTAIGDLFLRCRLLAQSIRKEYDALKGDIAILMDEGHDVSQIRAPLDFLRPAVVRPPWRPFMLVDYQTSKNADVACLLRELYDDVAGRSPNPTPLLLDEKIHHQLLRFMYGRGYQEWDAAALLRRMPPLFGVWHAYKQTVVQVWREFHPFFLYAVRGTISPGTTFPCKVSLRSIEATVAAMLRAYVAHRAEWKAAFRTLVVRQKTLQSRVNAVRALDAIQSGASSSSVATGAGTHSTESVEGMLARLQAMTTHIGHIESLEILLDQFLPALLLLGWMVRESHWASHDPGTGRIPRAILLRVVFIFTRLGERAPSRLEYFQALTCALLVSEPWNDQVPGAAYSEELCEAGLSRLGHACESHPQLKHTKEITNLYLLSQCEDLPRSIRDSGVTRTLCSTVARNLALCYGSDRPVVSFVPWRASENETHAFSTWPTWAWIPGTLFERPQTTAMATDFRRVLLLLVRACPVEALVPTLQAVFPHREAADITGRQRSLDSLEDELLKDIPRQPQGPSRWDAFQQSLREHEPEAHRPHTTTVRQAGRVAGSSRRHGRRPTQRRMANTPLQNGSGTEERLVGIPDDPFLDEQ